MALRVEERTLHIQLPRDRAVVGTQTSLIIRGAKNSLLHLYISLKQTWQRCHVICRDLNPSAECCTVHCFQGMCSKDLILEEKNSRFMTSVILRSWLCRVWYEGFYCIGTYFNSSGESKNYVRLYCMQNTVQGHTINNLQGIKRLKLLKVVTVEPLLTEMAFNRNN